MWISSKTKKWQDAELMGDNIVGIILKEDSIDNLDQSPKEGRDVGEQAEDLRLWRFAHHEEKIENARYLASGLHGAVVVAEIKGQTYALKVFKKWKQPGPVVYPPRQAIFMTPLAYEARAFTRLASIGENGTWACECYGWMKLSDTQFETITAATKSKFPDLSRWVIVKEYIPEETNASHINEIFVRFNISKRARILPEDIRVDNYRASKIVDLSSALTAPCYGVNEWGFNWFYSKTVTWVFTWFNSQHPETLRSIHKLATQYCLAGQQAEALKLMEEVVTLQKNKLGADHPDTLRSIHDLANRYTEAVPISKSTEADGW